MEIMGHIAKNLKVNKLNLYIYYAVPIILLIHCFGLGIPELSGYNCFVQQYNEFVYKFIYYIAPCSLCIAIYIWLHYAPIYCKDIMDLRNAFRENDQYRKAYSRYIIWINQFTLKGNVGTSLIKIVFFLCWFCGFHYFYYCLFKIEVIPNSLVVLPFLFLLLITLVLNFSSYYLCISFVFLLKRISELDLEYNKIMPSATYGFQLLRKTAKMIYIYFLLDSFFCTIPYISFMYIHGAKNDKLDDFSGKVNFMTFFVLILGLVSFLVITFFISSFLKKIYMEWKRKALDEFHREIISRDVISDSAVNDLNDKIDKLQRDKISISGREIIIPIIVGVVDIIAAIIPILSAFIK